MKRITLSVSVTAASLLGVAERASADLVFASYPGSGGVETLTRYTGSGSSLGIVGIIGDESIDGVAALPNGQIITTGNTLGSIHVIRLVVSPGSTTPAQWGGPGYFEIGWNSHIFGSSYASSYLPSALNGILELDAATGAYIRNAIPLMGWVGSLAFDGSLTNSAGYVSGALYVGMVGGGTSRYRQTTAGTIMKDNAFTIATTASMEANPMDHSLLLSNGGNLNHYEGVTGASLGTFLTVPGTIVDFEFAPDNSLFVLGAAPYTVYHFNSDGSPIGNPWLLPSSAPYFAYVVPEPLSVSMLIPALLLVLRRKQSIAAN